MESINIHKYLEILSVVADLRCQSLYDENDEMLRDNPVGRVTFMEHSRNVWANIQK